MTGPGADQVVHAKGKLAVYCPGKETAETGNIPRHRLTLERGT